MRLGHLFSINIITIVFLIVISFLSIILVITMVKGLKEKRINNLRRTTKAKVVGKRTSLYSAMKHSAHVIYNNSPEDSSYYITFQLEDGKREELKVSGKYYSIIMVGDSGLLATEETRFVEFRKE